MNSWGYEKYQENEIMTNHPIENTILVYEKCVQRFRAVKKYYEDFKYSQADKQLEMLEQSFHELKLSVNDNADEELAKYLYMQYNFILEKIFEIQKFRKLDSLPVIEEMLLTLIDAYTEVLKIEQG